MSDRENYSIGKLFLGGVEIIASAVELNIMDGKSTIEVPIPLLDARVWDDFNQVLPDAPATDDLGVVHGTFGTHDVNMTGLDPGGTATRGYARWQVPVPHWYRADSAAVIRVTYQNVTSAPDGTSTLDLVVRRVGAPTVDINATAPLTVSGVTGSNNYDFTLTDTDIVPGDILDIRLDVNLVDAGNAAAIVPTVTDLRMRLTCT